VGFQKCYSDYSVFIRGTTSGSVILTVYVDGILLTGSDVGILKAKEYLKTHFVTKDMNKPSYFFDIEIAHSKYGVLSQ